MKVTYDKKAGTLYVQVSVVPSSFGIIARTEELVTNQVMVDYLASGEIYGIDVIGVDNVEQCGCIKSMDDDGTIHGKDTKLFMEEMNRVRSSGLYRNTPREE